MKKTVKIVIVLICISVLCYEGIALFRNIKAYKTAKVEYDTLNTFVYSKKIPTIQKSKKVKDVTFDFPNIEVDFKNLSEINPDIVAWVYIPSVNISYPVVQEKTIDEYVNKTFEGNESIAGCIFTDILSDSKFNGFHNMIFGHNMKDGSMFGKLKKIRDEGDLIIEDDPYVYIFTKDCVQKYRIFAYYKTNVGSKSYDVIKNKNDYDKFLGYIFENNLCKLNSEINFSNYPSILTLSTCSGKSGSGKRFVIHTCKESTYYF